MKPRDWLLDLLFPPKCPFCQTILEDPRSPLCPDCQPKLPWLEGKGGERRVDFADGCFSPLAYRDQVPEAVRRYKFGGVRAYAEPFGLLMAQCARDRGLEGDALVWAPLSPKRLRQRGYDQAELLARAACRLWDTEPVRLLNKSVDNPAQSGISDAAARRANVLGVYEVCGGAAGKRVLLIDDICTTGATLSECARVLKDAGAESVVCATVSKTREKFKK